MATLRPTVYLRDGLFPDRLQICAGTDANIDTESNGRAAVHLLHYRVCRSRSDEEQSAVEPKSPVHGTQPVLDHHQWNASGTVH